MLVTVAEQHNGPCESQACGEACGAVKVGSAFAVSQCSELRIFRVSLDNAAVKIISSRELELCHSQRTT